MDLGCERSARWHDQIYSFKDYPAEAEMLRAEIDSRRPGARSLLDVACGTGGQLRHLRPHYAVEGVDVSPAMLEIAGAKLPGVPLHQSDVRTLDLGRTFDAVICDVRAGIGSIMGGNGPPGGRPANKNRARHAAASPVSGREAPI